MGLGLVRDAVARQPKAEKGQEQADQGCVGCGLLRQRCIKQGHNKEEHGGKGEENGVDDLGGVLSHLSCSLFGGVEPGQDQGKTLSLPRSL